MKIKYLSVLLFMSGIQAVCGQTAAGGAPDAGSACDITAVKQVETADINARLDLDEYGGSKTLRGKATGWFTVQKINNRWWLVTPEGNGMISLGVVHVLQAKEQPIFKAAYKGDADFLIKDASENMLRWGFNSMGYGGINKRSTAAMTRQMPFVLSMEDLLGISRFSGKPERIDLFAPAARKLLADRIADNIAPVKDSKNLIGYFYVDVPLWWNMAARKQGNDWAVAYRKLPADAPGKAQYVDFLLSRRTTDDICRIYKTGAADRAALLADTQWSKTSPDDAGVLEDDKAFAALIAGQYYKLCCEELRKQDPNHLIFGDRFASHEFRQLEEIIKAASPYIDAVTFQSFDKNGFESAVYDRAAEITGRPVLICDFATNFSTPEYPKGMWTTYATEDEAADAYARYLNDAFARPYTIGIHRCTYIDRPREGTLKQGLIQQSGKPYVRTIQRYAEIHRDLYERLYNASATKKP